MDFQTPYNRIVDPGEPGGGGTKTSQVYVPAHVQILAMIEAGKRLDLSRRPDLFDDEEPDLEPVPLRGPDVDLADLSEQVERLSALVRSVESRVQPDLAKPQVQISRHAGITPDPASPDPGAGSGAAAPEVK